MPLKTVTVDKEAELTVADIVVSQPGSADPIADALCAGAGPPAGRRVLGSRERAADRNPAAECEAGCEASGSRGEYGGPPGT